MFNWFKKKQDPKFLKEETLVYVKPSLSALDYPRKEYSVYWETFLDPVEWGWHAEVRFMSYQGEVKEIHAIDGPTKENVEGLVEKLVKDKMTNYKVN